MIVFCVLPTWVSKIVAQITLCCLFVALALISNEENGPTYVGFQAYVLCKFGFSSGTVVLTAEFLVGRKPFHRVPAGGHLPPPVYRRMPNDGRQISRDSRET
jgi:hypothetical protein